MSKPPKAVIFDFDNTLVKTMFFVSTHINEVCSRMKIECPTDESILSVLKENLPFEEVFEKLFPQRSKEVLENYRSDAETKPFSPTEGGINLAKSNFLNGVFTLIVSNRTRLMDIRLEQAGYELAWFGGIDGLIEANPRKPDPGAFLNAIQFIKDRFKVKGEFIDNNEIFVIGDSVDDYKSAINTGVNFIAVLAGPNTKEDFIEAGLDEADIRSSLEDIHELYLGRSPE